MILFYEIPDTELFSSRIKFQPVEFIVLIPARTTILKENRWIINAGKHTLQKQPYYPDLMRMISVT